MRTVLVVEDDFLLAEEYSMIFDEAGWQVIGPASTVNEALDLLGNIAPTVALLDFHLGRDAVTPVAEVLARRGIPFLAASAAVDLVALGGPVFQGIRNLGKPIQDTEMVDAVNTIANARMSNGS